MAETVGQHSVAAFTSPVNGTSPIDANTVKGNDNTIRSAYVDHDADPGIHVQSSTLASRPTANSAGRKWMTADSGVVRLFYDDGTNWYEADYLRTTGGTISGNLAVTGTLNVTGVTTLTAQPVLSSLTASRAVFTDGSKGLVSNAITGTGDVVMSASPTLTGTIQAAAANLSGALGVSGLLTFASLKGTGATTVTDILNDGTMATASATTLATSASIKTYVDAQVGASDALSEVLAIGNTTGANDIIVSTGQKIRTPAVAAGDGSAAITIANTTGALTLATALADSNLATISTAGKVANSATTATNANTASAIVARDASGNFSAGTITATLNGAAPAGSLTGTTLASNVVTSSLTAVGTIATGVWQGTAISDTYLATISTAGKVANSATTATSANTASAIVARDSSGNFSAGTITATLSGAAPAGSLSGTTLASNVVSSSLTSLGTLTSLTVNGDITASTNQLKLVASTGNLGIGTATPAYKLDVAGSANVSTGNTYKVNGTDVLSATTLGSGVTASSLTSVGTLTSLTVSGNAFAATSSGRLVVGNTTGANYKLESYSASGNNGITVNIGSDTASDFAALDFRQNGVQKGVLYTNQNSLVINANAGALTLQTGAATRATIDASGNLAVDTNTLYVDAANNRVGVGTASPGSPLDVIRASTSTTALNEPQIRAINTAAATLNQRVDIAMRWEDGTYNGTGGISMVRESATARSGSLVFSSINSSGDATQAMRLDASGNLGLGVTPSAWDTAVFRTVQIGTGAGSASLSGRADGAKDMVLGSNLYYGTGNWRYVGTGVATRYRMDGGAHEWSTAASGTAGNVIPFTPAMTLDASGNLLVGTTSSLFNSAGRGVIEINGSSQAILGLESGGVNRMYLQTIGTNNYIVSNALPLQIEATGSNIVNFATNSTERARITSGGYFKASNDGTYFGSAGSYHEFRTTQDTNILILTATNASLSSDVVQIRASRNTTNNSFYAINYYNDGAGAYKFRVADSGNVTNTNGSYGTISDIKHKQDVIDAPSQWNDLKAVRFRKFRMKSDVEANPDAPFMLGVIAQELEQTSSGLVDEHPDFEEQEVTDEDGNVTTERVQVGTTKSVKSSILLMKAAVALQEAMARIEALEARLEALEA